MITFKLEIQITENLCGKMQYMEGIGITSKQTKRPLQDFLKEFIEGSLKQRMSVQESIYVDVKR
uniref:Uncharacterized protein n=1 Tax=viral metagenome TaxID=1070528 RepID=A0A6M3K4T7_9ZZZZ